MRSPVPESSGLRVRELTPPGRGGVAVLSVRGPGALQRVRELARGRAPRPGVPALLRLYAGEELLDEAVCWRESDDEVELHVHGSPALVRRVARALAPVPADPPGLADPAAAARSLAEEALERCDEARSEAAARVLLDQAEGAWERGLRALSAADDAALEEGLRQLAARGRFARWLLSPPRVVLAGPVNAGKSTLFNVLVGRERVVVSDEAGTTRDAVRESVLFGRWAVDLFDTAGEGGGEGTGEGLDEASRALSRALREEADLVLWLSPDPEDDGTAAGPPWLAGRARAPLVGLTSRADLLGPAERARVRAPVSALADPEGARARVGAEVRAALGLPEEPWTPGAAVPFRAAERAAVEELLACADPGERRVLLARLVAR